MGYWIVAVDDEPLSLKKAKEQLNEKGMRVSCLRSGKELLAFMESNEPDLILLDYDMPITPGPQVMEMIRSEPDSAQVPGFVPASRDGGVKDTSVRQGSYMQQQMELFFLQEEHMDHIVPEFLHV